MHDPGMEGRVERLELDMHDVKATLGRLEPMIVAIHAQMPFLATKAEVAQLRGDLDTKIERSQRELEAKIEGVRGDLHSQIQGVRSDLQSQIQGVRSDLHSQIQDVRSDLQSQIQDGRGEVQSVRNDLQGQIQGVRGDLEALRGEVRAGLASKPGFAAMWTMAITLFALVVASMAAGAAYLPLVSHWADHLK